MHCAYSICSQIKNKRNPIKNMNICLSTAFCETPGHHQIPPAVSPSPFADVVVRPCLLYKTCNITIFSYNQTIRNPYVENRQMEGGRPKKAF